MTKEEREDFYDKAMEKWGLDAQLNMCIEEMSELTKEICKFRRCGFLNKPTAEVQEHMMEELADVYNMLDQIARMFDREKIEQIRDEKIQRCMKKLQ